MAIEQDHQVRHFNTDVAMQLVDAFYRQPSLQGLLATVYRQLSNLVDATGLAYGPESRADGASATVSIGTTRKHHMRYNLSWPGLDLGFVTVYFDQRASETALETTEDLLTLAAGALHLQRRNGATGTQLETTAEARNTSEAEDTTNTSKAVTKSLKQGKRAKRQETLVLLEIDGFEDLVEAQGSAWALAVTQSLQALIEETLREADSVFQIEMGQLAVLMPNTTPAGAEAVTKKLCVLVGTLHLSSGDVRQQLTACMGIATGRADDTPEGVLDRARHALERAKEQGPNAVSSGNLRLV